MTHRTGSGQPERRAKGRNNKPKIYLAIEIFILAMIVFFVSFAQIKIVTISSALVAIFVVIMSCLPRYKRIMVRQTEHKVYNNTHH